MDVLDDNIEVAHGVRDEQGQKLEPEQQPARRVVDVRADVAVDRTGVDESVPLQPRTMVTFNAQAEELAHNVMTRCGGCIYFDNPQWLRIKRENEAGDIQQRRELNEIRGALLGLGGAVLEGEGDSVEEALSALGICNAQTELFMAYTRDPGDFVIVAPDGGCPMDPILTDEVPGGIDVSNLFKPRNAEMRKATLNERDRILRMAQGRGADLEAAKKIAVLVSPRVEEPASTRTEEAPTAPSGAPAPEGAK